MLTCSAWPKGDLVLSPVQFNILYQSYTWLSTKLTAEWLLASYLYTRLALNSRDVCLPALELKVMHHHAQPKFHSKQTLLMWWHFPVVGKLKARQDRVWGQPSSSFNPQVRKWNVGGGEDSDFLTSSVDGHSGIHLGGKKWLSEIVGSVTFKTQKY